MTTFLQHRWLKRVNPTVMKRLIMGLMVILSLPLSAQDYSSLHGGVPYHPYRRVGDKYYSIQPIYDWLATRHIPPEKLNSEQRKLYEQFNPPMPEWYGVGAGSFKVFQVVDDGLLLREFGGNILLLKNYPLADKVVDGQVVQFIALKTGIYKYTDTTGGTRTVPAYDYGTPYNPFEKQTASQTTNSNSASSSPTNAPAKAP